jgi:hypothetical protein
VRAGQPGGWGRHAPDGYRGLPPRTFATRPARYPSDDQPDQETDADGGNDLAQAVLAEDLVAAGETLRAGSDPNAKDPLGHPPLCLAAASRR